MCPPGGPAPTRRSRHSRKMFAELRSYSSSPRTEGTTPTTIPTATGSSRRSSITSRRPGRRSATLRTPISGTSAPSRCTCCSGPGRDPAGRSRRRRDLKSIIRSHFGPENRVDIELPERDPARELPSCRTRCGVFGVGATILHGGWGLHCWDCTGHHAAQTIGFAIPDASPDSSNDSHRRKDGRRIGRDPVEQPARRSRSGCRRRLVRARTPASQPVVPYPVRVSGAGTLRGVPS